MIMYGKTMGNGYAITAVVGKKDVMESAQKTFISSTFWTERIGPAAALKSLEVMNKIKSWELITEIGRKVSQGWIKLSEENGIKIKVSGLPAISTYVFDSANHLKYKTLVTQEMLKRGFLASTHFYACIDHTDDLINLYFDCLDEVFKILKKCESEKLNISELLDGPVCHSGFKRLN